MLGNILLNLNLPYNQNMKNIFYVYVHRRNDTGSVFYVGKGSRNRAFWKNNRNKHWHFIVDKHGYKVEIVINNLTEQYAFDLEKELIAFYGRSNLCNYSDGGDGSSGAIRTEEMKNHMREKMLGRKFSDATIKKMKIAANNRSKETREKQASAIRGRKLTEEHKLKISISGIGRITSEESRKKISDFHKGKKKNPDAVAKMAASKSKPVFCITNDTEYPSMSEAARILSLKSSHISSVCNGKAKSTKGYVFHIVE